METSSPYQLETVLALGEKLVKELKLSTSVDTLGRWMAHYIAELMEQAEKAPSEEQRQAAQQACYNTILKLWYNRSTALPDVRPLASLKPALAVLKSINGQDESNIYWRHDTRNTQQPWADFISSLRSMVDSVVLYCISGSVNYENLNQEKEWVEVHSELLSDDERDTYKYIDALLQGGRALFQQVVWVESEIKELNAEERQNLILVKIKEAFDNQITKLNQLQAILTKKDDASKNTDVEDIN